MKKHSIQLSKEQRDQVEQLIRKGTAPARHILHAQVLLKAESGENGPNWSNRQIQEAFGVGEVTIWRIRRRFLDHGLTDAIERRPQPERPQKRKIDGEQEAYLIALACGKPPEGRERWTMRLLADKLIQLGYVDQVSHKTVWVTLKKTNSNPG